MTSTGTVWFLVVAARGSVAWGIDVERVEAIDDGAGDDALDVADLRGLGLGDDREAPRRVVRVRAGGTGRRIAVRGKLEIVSVPREDILALPALLTDAMRPRAFRAVVLGEPRPAFLILDLEAAIGAAA